MKVRNLATMAITVLLMAACSLNEITEISPEARPAVGFSVYATPQTRGTITDNSTIQNATGFGILAYYTGQSVWNNTGSFAPNFMYNQQVKYSLNTWSYTPMKYWPNTEGDKITFFAYAPYSASSGTNGITLSDNTATGAPTMKFQLQTTPSALIDLVATNATAATHTSGANQVVNVTKRTSAVPFKFDHVLTRVNFKAKLDAVPAPDTYIFVTGMRLLGNDKNSGTTLYSSATYKFADGTWDYTSATTAQASDYAINTMMPLSSQVSEVTKYLTNSINITSVFTGNDLLAPNQYLFLIPPTDNTGVAADKVKVQIDYDIVTKDAKLNGGFSKTSTSATVSLPTGTLKRNTAYDYLFTIGLEKVQISATVTDWSLATDVVIPAVDATAGSATAIGTAITTLNATKGDNPNCNYFVVNIPHAAASATLALSATTGHFKVGDKIELNFTVRSSVTSVSLSGWTSSGTLSAAIGKIILTKN